ncbi:heavy metal transporter [uncultured Microbacterium sp.]|uniref:Predicted Co/Zn/Cd cation transporters n=1 Tax=uncultured Microbacterium sp. TaxID=191216 RepID=A0A1Y5P336_9MICO|nr:heavy metal transporter [uncultured Microbacterium sp.]SBS73073.1 Predicted Co/Zn/Cd cation transporters [uncultured Microbacterium sp.]
MSDPRRVRVTADPGPRRAGAVTRGIALPDAPVDEADAVFARALRRTQLRLALGTVSGFVIVVVALSLAIVAIPGLEEIVLIGVPLPWLLHAFAYYPVVLVFALLYARGADRNERRYRALRERE